MNNIVETYNWLYNKLNTLNEELGSPLFDNMPSMNKEGMRPTEISSQEFFNLLKSKEMKKILNENPQIFHDSSFSVNGIFATCIFFDYVDKKEDKDLYYNLRRPALNKGKLIMQNFCHEIDINTPFYLETAWAGNCGQFADKIYYRYVSNDDGETLLRNISKYQDSYRRFRNWIEEKVREGKRKNKIPCITYINLKKEIKNTERSTDLNLEDVKQEILDFANEYIKTIKPNYHVELVTGKRQADNESKPYEAFVLYGGNNEYDQLGSFVLTQNKWGDCIIKTRGMFCSAEDEKLDLENYKDTIKYTINWLTH